MNEQALDLANVGYRIDGRIAIVTIRRPKLRNAVDSATAAELFTAFSRFDADDALDVAILTGEGDTFCAGYDLQAVARGEIGRVEPDGPGPMGPTRMRLGKPVIAAVEGHAVAGGMELALWCDLRVASSEAVFGIFCRRFGVPLVDLGTIRLPRLVGHSVAMDLILTGRPVGAVEGKQIGLVNRIAPVGHALVAALELAKSLSALPQRCLRNDRLSAIEQWSLGEDEAMRNEIRYGLDTLAHGDVVAGAGRFAKGDGRHGLPSGGE